MGKQISAGIYCICRADVIHGLPLCATTPVELVASEYYRDELAYQHVIDGTKNANALSQKLSIHQDADKIVIEFPPEMIKQAFNRECAFYTAPR